jgi:hypothetical protein
MDGRKNRICFSDVANRGIISMMEANAKYPMHESSSVKLTKTNFVGQELTGKLKLILLECMASVSAVTAGDGNRYGQVIT